MNSSVHNVESTLLGSSGGDHGADTFHVYPYVDAYDIMAKREQRTQDAGEISPRSMPG